MGMKEEVNTTIHYINVRDCHTTKIKTKKNRQKKGKKQQRNVFNKDAEQLPLKRGQNFLKKR